MYVCIICNVCMYVCKCAVFIEYDILHTICDRICKKVPFSHTKFDSFLKFETSSWTTIVVHSRDDKEVGVAHKVKSPENQP